MHTSVTNVQGTLVLNVNASGTATNEHDSDYQSKNGLHHERLTEKLIRYIANSSTEFDRAQVLDDLIQ